MVIFIGDKGLGAYWLLTAVANETALMPCGASILKLPGSCEREREKRKPLKQTISCTDHSATISITFDGKVTLNIQ